MFVKPHETEGTRYVFARVGEWVTQRDIWDIVNIFQKLICNSLYKRRPLNPRFLSAESI